METVFIAIGSNVGDMGRNIDRALELLNEFVYNYIPSSRYQTKPYGVTDQPFFLNMVIQGETNLEPLKLLKKLKNIEKLIGRQERERWGPREIDLDIILYGDAIIDLSDLSIPHRDVEQRDFVLVPLLEIDPTLKNPRTGRGFQEILNELPSGDYTIIKKDGGSIDQD